jgi:hypothetical protein
MRVKEKSKKRPFFVIVVMEKEEVKRNRDFSDP